MGLWSHCFLDRLHDPLGVDRDNEFAEADVICECAVVREGVEPWVALEGQVRFAPSWGSLDDEKNC